MLVGREIENERKCSERDCYDPHVLEKRVTPVLCSNSKARFRESII